jgi:23S rRNA (uracil1939-C5)-methyltransferase
MNHDGSEVLLAVWLRDQDGVKQAAAGLEKLCDALRKLLPALTGAICNAPGIAAHRGGAPAGRHKRQRCEDAQHGEREGRELASWGVPRMTYQVAGIAYRVSLGAFFQVNRMLTGKLVELSTGSRRGALAWDLYAGVGLFSCVLASHFEQVVAVEGAPVSCDDLRANLGAPHRAVESSTVGFLRREVARRSPKTALAQPEFVLVDPPRAGLGEEAVHLLAQIGPPEITYVSCDPATLSRDLRRLLDSGYKLEGLHLIDLFPQTFHLETVAMLTRR